MNISPIGPCRAAENPWEISNMIVVVEAHNAEKHARLLEQMFCLRARIFHDHLGWDVAVKHGKERDKYDDQNPVYIIYTNDDGCEVKGSLRLLPTTGPTLVADFFSDTLPDAADLMAPTIWECTRFCLDENVWQKDKEEIVFAATVLLVALGDLALREGSNRSSEISMPQRCTCGDVSGARWRYSAPPRDMGARSILACTRFPKRSSPGSRKS